MSICCHTCIQEDSHDWSCDVKDNSVDKRENFDNKIQAMMADVGIVDHSTEDYMQVDHIHRDFIFDILKMLNPASQSTSQVTSPNISTSNQMKHPPCAYGPKAHYQIVFKKRGESLHSMSHQRQIKLPLVVQAIHDILNGSMDLSNRSVNPSNTSFILSSGLLNKERICTPRYQSRKYHHLPGICEIERSRVCQAVWKQYFKQHLHCKSTSPNIQIVL